MLRLNVLVNNFSVRTWVLPIFSGSKVSQGHNTAEVGFNTRPLAPESDALQLGRRAPPGYQHLCFRIKQVFSLSRSYATHFSHYKQETLRPTVSIYACKFRKYFNPRCISCSKGRKTVIQHAQQLQSMQNV